MPFVYDQTQVAWPDDDTEPPPPRVDQFVYIAAADFGGGRPPVRFDVPPLRGAADSTPEQPAPPPPAPPQERGGVRKFLQGLLAQRPSTPTPAQPRVHQARREWEQRWERIRSIMIPALQQIGGRRICCRYDGGNDEGFAWFESLELDDGQRLDRDATAQRLHAIQVYAALRAAGAEPQGGFPPRADELAERWALQDSIGLLCDDWATLLLGRAFGTGEYSMFGAFTVDLETRTITDDPHADPVVENIRIDQ